MISALTRTIRSINWRSRKTIGAIIVILLIIAAGVRALSGSENIIAGEEVRARTVSVARISELANGAASISTIGEVQSRSEAAVRAESSGRVTRVRAALGDSVGAGAILAEIENSSQRAAVLQAEGAYDAAKASLQKVQGGTRDEQLAILKSSANAARNGAVNTLLSTYATVDNAIKDSTDQMFSNPDGANPQFNISTSDSQAKLDIQNARPQIGLILQREARMATSLDASIDLLDELSKSESELRSTRTYLDTIVRALNAGVSAAPYNDASIAAFKADAIAARTSINASLGAVASSRTAIETAEKNLEQGVTGAQAEDVASAAASVKQAEGAYHAALANLEKTIIRSPITGTINSFSIHLGDIASPGQEVAVVSNNSALEIVAYVSETDRSAIVAGANVEIEGGFTGTVTHVAPALDPLTRRIEVKIGVPQSAVATLTNGQSVRIHIEHSSGDNAKIDESGTLVPLSAIKLEADRSVVFTVDENGTLVAVPVTIGAVTGNTIEIIEGADANLEIVTDARGLKEGDSVYIQGR